MIEKLDEDQIKIITSIDGIKLISDVRCYLQCGCEVAIGIRIDNKEVCTAAKSCCLDHEILIHRFNLEFYDSLANPTDRKLIEYVDTLLERVSKEIATEQ